MSEPSHAHVIALYPGLPQSQSRNTVPLAPSLMVMPLTQAAHYQYNIPITSHSSHTPPPARCNISSAASPWRVKLASAKLLPAGGQNITLTIYADTTKSSSKAPCNKIEFNLFTLASEFRKRGRSVRWGWCRPRSYPVQLRGDMPLPSSKVLLLSPL